MTVVPQEQKIFILKEEGHYFPQLSDRVRDPKEFQLYLFQKL